MTRTFQTLALASLAMAALAGCDSKPAAPETAATEPAAAPTPPPPPPPLDVASAMAAVDQKTLCGLFARASADAKVRVTGGDCVVTSGPTEIAIATKDGKSKLTVPLVEAGAVVPLTPAIVSTQSVADANGGFSNIGAVFIGRAPASGLCMSLDYVAVDGSSNSVFVSTDPAVKGAAFDVAKTGAASGGAAFPEPVVKAGAIAAVAVSRREAGMVVKSVSFKAC